MIPHMSQEIEIQLTEAQQQQQQQQQAASIDPNKFKTKICRNWQQGECMYSERCAFAHGEVDKRRTGDLVAMRKMQQTSYDQIYFQQQYNNTTNGYEQHEIEMYSALDNSSYVESTCDEMMTPQTSIMTPVQTPITKSLFTTNVFPCDDKSQCSSTPSFPVYRYEPYGSDQVSQVPVESFSEIVSSDEAISDNENSVSSTERAATPDEDEQ